MHIAFTLQIMIQSDHNFAYATCFVQIWGLVISLESKLEQHNGHELQIMRKFMVFLSWAHKPFEK